MKNLKVITLSFLVLFSHIVMAADQSGYYRVWQGFKKPELSAETFNQALPAFMQSTVSLYDDSLNNYLVAITPANKPAFVPDEIALIGIRSEAEYLSIRKTPAGQAYGESHWQIFDKSNSKSVAYSTLVPEVLENNVAYDVAARAVDWRKGHTTFFIGTRKPGVSSQEFLKRLSAHVIAAQAVLALNGYIIVANENYEIAFMNWPSKEKMAALFSTKGGQALQKDAASFMDTLQWNEVQIFDQKSVTPGESYTTKSL